MPEVGNYIQQFPEPVQDILSRIRRIIREAAPDATEEIAYGIAGYKLLNKPLVYFAAFKNHIGLYATPTGHERFRQALASYKQGKGSVQFPIRNPIPYDIIEALVAYRVIEVRGSATGQQSGETRSGGTLAEG